MPRAALRLLLIALAGTAHAAPASRADAAAVAADPAIATTPGQVVPPSLSQARTGPAPSGQTPSDPASLPATPPPAASPDAAPVITTQPGASQDTPAAGAPSGRQAAPSAAAQPGGLEAPAGHADTPSTAAPAVPPPVLPLPPNTARLSVSGMLGRLVAGPDRQDIGRVVDVLVDGTGVPRAAVIDFGGFMGLGSRKIAVDWSAFSFPPAGSDAALTIALRPEQIKDTPEYSGTGKPVAVIGQGTPVPRPGP